MVYLSTMSKKTDTFDKKEEKELKKLLAEKREALRDFRFSMKGSRVRNTKEGSLLRKDIARILGVLGSRLQATNTTE
jgi:ribosomal protein L29